MPVATDWNSGAPRLEERRSHLNSRPLSPEDLETLTGIVGEGNVSAAPEEIARLTRTTLPAGTTPAGIVWASRREEVQGIVAWAAATRFPIYPISTAKNWGYGDACAPVSGCLLLDLSRMNRILEVDPKLAYAVVEPGVTQGQLARYLEENGVPLMVDATGAGPDASLIGNTLERGFGHTPYGDRFAHAACLEAVLPDGSLLTTGFGAYPGARAQHLYKWGFGPSLDGLLTQSNFAVVTRMTVWLMPKAERLLAYVITLSNPRSIGPLIERLRPLRLAGTLRSTSHCFNQTRLLAGSARFPYERVDGREPLEISDPGWIEENCRKRRIPAWAVSGSIAGSRAEIRAACRALKRALSGLPGHRLLLFDEQRLSGVERVLGFLSRWKAFAPPAALIKNVRLGYQLLAGRPAYESLKGVHWRTREESAPIEDPLAGPCGLVWIAPVIPMTAEAVEDLQRVVEPIVHRCGFEFQVAMTLINERSICAILPISYDRASSEETARAAECHERLLDALVAGGYIPYRSSPAGQERIRKAAPQYWDAVARLKRAWDPDDILAPGRYLPRLTSSRNG